MAKTNKTESKNDQSAPSESSEEGCTATKFSPQEMARILHQDKIHELDKLYHRWLQGLLCDCEDD